MDMGIKSTTFTLFLALALLGAAAQASATAIISAPPPGGRVGVKYSHEYYLYDCNYLVRCARFDGHISLTTGKLPPGLNLENARYYYQGWRTRAFLSGTPTKAGTFAGTVTVTRLPDATHAGFSASQSFRIVIRAAAPVTTSGAQQPAAQTARQPLRYRLVDLGTLGGANSGNQGGGRQINSHGVTTGWAETTQLDPILGTPAFHAFRWRDGVMTDLGTLAGGADSSYADAINSEGMVAGWNDVLDPTYGAGFVATLWKKDGGIVNLGTFGGPFGLAADINDQGQVVGGAETTQIDSYSFFADYLGLPSPTQYHAALWQHGRMKDLGTLGGPGSFALDINQRGDVVGLSYSNSVVNKSTGHPTVAPFLWRDGRMINLGTLGGVEGWANAVNNNGQVVGGSRTRRRGPMHAFLWENGEMRDLIAGQDSKDSEGKLINDAGDVVIQTHAVLEANGQPYFWQHHYLWQHGVVTDLAGPSGIDQITWANEMNSKGQIAGQAYDGTAVAHAVLWDNSRPVVDLNDFVPPGTELVLTEAMGINDRGEIVVLGQFPDGDVHSFLLVPRD
jgi:probable HAF family extracellular repeat protein